MIILIINESVDDVADESVLKTCFHFHSIDLKKQDILSNWQCIKCTNESWVKAKVFWFVWFNTKIIIVCLLSWRWTEVRSYFLLRICTNFNWKKDISLIHWWSKRIIDFDCLWCLLTHSLWITLKLFLRCRTCYSLATHRELNCVVSHHDLFWRAARSIQSFLFGLCS